MEGKGARPADFSGFSQQISGAQGQFTPVFADVRIFFSSYNPVI
jgi:hypothetical protein